MNKKSKNETKYLEAATVANYQVYAKKHVKAASFNALTPTTSLPVDSTGSSSSIVNEYSNLAENTPVNVLCTMAAHPQSVLRAKAATTQINEAPLAHWAKGNERITEIRLNSHSHRVFACNLMVEFFTNAELTNPNCNVRGLSTKGNNRENMVRLDPTKIMNIRIAVLGYVEGSSAVKEAVWKDCITAMNQKMSRLKKEKKLSENN